MIGETEPIHMKELLEIMGGDRNLMLECFDEFLLTFQQALDDIQTSIQQGSPSDLNVASHRLKGSLDYLAATQAANAAYDLETMDTIEDFETISNAFRRLCVECEKVKSFIETYKTEHHFKP